LKKFDQNRLTQLTNNKNQFLFLCIWSSVYPMEETIVDFEPQWGKLGDSNSLFCGNLDPN
jgi:hypothetical protein